VDAGHHPVRQERRDAYRADEQPRDRGTRPPLPDFEEIDPDAYERRIKRDGVIDAWDDPAFAAAVRRTGRPKLLMGGLTTDVCLVPPALSAKAGGFDVVALMDISAA
jgi:nicotinamidase-related amidase